MKWRSPDQTFHVPTRARGRAGGGGGGGGGGGTGGGFGAGGWRGTPTWHILIRRIVIRRIQSYRTPPLSPAASAPPGIYLSDLPSAVSAQRRAPTSSRRSSEGTGPAHSVKLTQLRGQVVALSLPPVAAFAAAPHPASFVPASHLRLACALLPLSAASAPARL